MPLHPPQRINGPHDRSSRDHEDRDHISLSSGAELRPDESRANFYDVKSGLARISCIDRP
jgi:hypothetical protein